MTILLVALNKGWVDGYYFDDNLADEAWYRLSKQYPDEGWVATKVLSNSVEIPDSVFHTNARYAEELK